MISLEQAEEIYKAAKELRDDALKLQKMKNKSAEMHYVGYSDKKISKLNTDVTFLAIAIDKSEFKLHTQIVKAGICPPFSDDYYCFTTHKPTGFHNHAFQRQHPLKG